jgi:branched-chain amino acid transport system permease protein
MAQGNGIKYLPLVGVIAVFLAFPFLYTNPYILHILILCIIWSVVASAWNLILGYAGVISFGQLAFFTLGAYTVGMLHKFLHISPWIGLGLAGIVPSLVGLGIGLVCLRLRGIYVLLITLSLQEIVPVFIKWQTQYTGGAVGFSDMPALRDSENFARTLGVNDYKYKVLVFIISAFITGVMGGLYGLYIGFATPSLCGWEYVVILLIAIFLGGEGKFPGEIIGTFFVIAATELLQGTSSLREAALGTTIILVVFLLPGGLISLIHRLRKKTGKGLLKTSAGQSG